MKMPSIERSSNDTKMKSVLLISDSDDMSEKITAAVGGMPDFVLKAQKGTLAGMNGSAVSLAAANDVVIFDVKDRSHDDMTSVMAIRRDLGQSAKLLALTADDISLAEARNLTKAGVDEILTRSFDVRDFCQQLERWTSPNALVIYPDQPNTTGTDGKVIAVAKTRGGVGATTVCVNLADQLLGRSGVMRKTVSNRVVLVDLDFQFGAVASFVDVDPRDGLFQLASEGIEPDTTFLRQSIVTTKYGIDVLTAPSRFAPIDGLKASQIATMIQLLRREYDYVVVDLPFALVEWMAPVLEAANKVLLVTDSSVPSIRQARRLIDFYIDDNPALQIDIVVSGEKKPMLRSNVHAEAVKILERPLKYWLPPDPKAARSAIDRGVPLSEAAGRSGLTKSMKAMTKDLVIALSKSTQNSTAIV